VASALDHTVGSVAAAFFAVVLLNASLIGAGTVTLASSYVIGDIFVTRASLHRSFREAKGFYSIFSVLILAAAGIVLIPGAPLGLITLAVQALCGILLPMTTMFLLMLSNDREVLGPWANPPWLKALAAVIVGALVLLSLILTVTTLFPAVNVTDMAIGGAIALAAGLVLLSAVSLRARRGLEAVTPIGARPEVPREQWTMPPATLLTRPGLSMARRLAISALGSYMVVAIALLIVKTVQLASG
jgi:hypothetical protein